MGTKVCNACETGKSLATGEVRIQDLLDEMYTYGRSLANWGMYDEFAKYETIFFDRVQETDPTTGEVYYSYKFKDKLAMSADVFTNDKCEVEWNEPRVCGSETVVAENANVGTSKIKVKSLKPLGGIGVGSNLVVTSLTSGNPITGLYISAIDSAENEFTLTKPLAVALKAGDIVRRGAYLRNRGCEVSIDNTVELDGFDKYSAKFRTISISHDINGCDLNKPYLVKGGAQAILNARFKKGEVQAVKEFIHAVFYDSNEVIDGKRSETRGLFPAMARAQEEMGLKIAFDLKGCCKAELNECTNAKAQIQAFFDIVFNKTKESGMFDTEVTIAMNMKAQENLFAMQTYFQDFGGVGFLDGSDYDVDIGLPRVRYAGKTLTFKYLPILDEFAWPVMLTIPEDRVAVYQKKYQFVNADLQLEKAPLNSSIEAGMPVLRYVDANTELANKLGECQKIVGDIDFAVVWMGVDKGAYRIIKNFGSCVEPACSACGLDDVKFINA